MHLEFGWGLDCDFLMLNILQCMKAGVNVSVIRGDLKPALAAQMSSRGKDLGPGWVVALAA